jgi:hypothetical protein
MLNNLRAFKVARIQSQTFNIDLVSLAVVEVLCLDLYRKQRFSGSISRQSEKPSELKINKSIHHKIRKYLAG